MSLKHTSKKWTFQPSNTSLQEIFTKALNIHPVVAQILINRNITNIDSAKEFLSPSLDKIKVQGEIPGLQDAALLIHEAIQKKEKIMVYGDYDVDGITGTTLLTSAITALGGSTTYYIPHRYDEGYGLNTEAIKRAVEQKVNMIITVDCGISNVEEVKFARSLGLKIIITDHHNPPGDLPDANAIVDPKLRKEHYFFKNLAGVGVAFKVAEAIFILAGRQNDIYKNNFLDLVALGTVTDIVPMLDANRGLTALGLNILNQGNRLGLKLLHKISNCRSTVSTHSIGFVIGPRLNAAGRLDDASVAVELLLTDDEDKALQLASRLNELNDLRRRTGESIKEDAINIIENIKGIAQEKALVITEHDWHPGIIGIVASQLARTYNKPTALIAVNEGIGRGSVRSISGIDIFTPLASCHNHFIDFGGHKEAAGFKIKEENIAAFTAEFQTRISELILSDSLSPTLEIDTSLNFSDITFNLVEELASLAPHGQENSPPVFASNGVKFIDCRTVGNGTHLKMQIESQGTVLDAIGFNMGHLLSKTDNQLANIAYTIEINEWNGQQKLQLNLQDLKTL